MKIIFGLLIVILIVSAAEFMLSLAQQDAGTYVRVKGYGAIVDKDIPRARDEAKRDAFRAAVEQVVGVEIKAETEVERFQVVKDIILTKSQGYVKSFRVISEGQPNDQEYLVEAGATVMRGKMPQDDFDSLTLLIQLMGNPRIAVMIEEENAGKVQTLSTMASAITTNLKKVGYMMVEESQMKLLRQTLKSGIEGGSFALINPETAFALTSMASESQAEVIILGKVFSEVTGRVKAGMFDVVTARARGHIDAVIAETGQIVYSVDLNTEKAEKGNTDAAAGRKAIDSLTAQIADELPWKLASAIKEVINIKMFVRRCSYAQANEIEKLIRSMRFVLEVTPRPYQEPTAEFDIRTSGSSRDLAARLQKGMQLNVKKVGMGVIDVELAP